MHARMHAYTHTCRGRAITEGGEGFQCTVVKVHALAGRVVKTSAMPGTHRLRDTLRQVWQVVTVLIAVRACLHVTVRACLHSCDRPCVCARARACMRVQV